MDTSRPILFLAFANDRDDRARYLRNLADEARQVREALDAAEQRDHCELILRQNATAGDILDVFQDARYRNRVAIFHFGGHADGYRLLLETAEGKPAAAEAGGLARFLTQQRALQLVFLNGCSTEGQVSGLLDAGVSAVIATDQAVEDGAATDFAARFYGGLAGGAAIGAAFEEAKAAMQIQGGVVFRHIGAAEEDLGAGRSPWQVHVLPGAEDRLNWSLAKAADDPFFGLPELPPAALPNRPYLYLEQYTVKHAAIFFGRGQEIRTLYDSVTAPTAERVILYYGQSGVGKSSLLEAGLLPRLAGEHVIQYQRRDHEKQLSGTLAAMVAAAAAEADIAVGPDESVTQMWRAIEQHTGKPVVLILDQVEECFTRVSQGALGAVEVEQLLVEIHDLFAAPENWPRGRLILGFRKEWLAEIHNRITAQEISFSEVFLERLNRAGIIEVVRGPTMPRLADKYHLTFKDEENLAEVIAADLLLDPESPIAVTLQVFLSRMWDRAVAKDRNHPIFDQALYEEMQREGKALGDFLDHQLVALRTTQEAAVRSGLALDILAYHTSDLGTAEEHDMAELEHEYRHQIQILPDLVREARELSLLVDPRPNQPDRPRANRLAHDTLAPLVRQRFSTSDAPGQRARRILESRGVQWHDGKAGPVLDGPDLSMVEAGRSGMRAWDASKGEIRLIGASRKARRRRKSLQVASIAVALAFLMLAGSLLLQQASDWWRKEQVQQTNPFIAVAQSSTSIQQFEVSNHLYSLFLKSTGRKDKASQMDDEFPKVNLDAERAMEFCNWIGGTLPSREQWLGAARRPFGDEKCSALDRNVVPNWANIVGISPEKAAVDVRSKAFVCDTTKDGIHHLWGNVSEWTRSADSGSIWDGSDFKVNLAVMGGSYLQPIREIGNSLPVPADFHDVDIGFRCVRVN